MKYANKKTNNMNELKKALDKLNDLKHKVQDGYITQVDLILEIADIESIIDSEFNYENSKNIDHYETFNDGDTIHYKGFGLIPFTLKKVDGDIQIGRDGILYGYLTEENCKDFVKS